MSNLVKEHKAAILRMAFSSPGRLLLSGEKDRWQRKGPSGRGSKIHREQKANNESDEEIVCFGRRLSTAVSAMRTSL
jgi:hypothetical protein